jgi:hypothetical protein
VGLRQYFSCEESYNNSMLGSRFWTSSDLTAVNRALCNVSLWADVIDNDSVSRSEGGASDLMALDTSDKRSYSY